MPDNSGLIWRCPRCGSKNLRVTISTVAELHQSGDGNFETSIVDDHEWDANSPMSCRQCDLIETAKDFDVETQVDATITALALTPEEWSRMTMGVHLKLIAYVHCYQPR